MNHENPTQEISYMPFLLHLGSCFQKCICLGRMLASYTNQCIWYFSSSSSCVSCAIAVMMMGIGIKFDYWFMLAELLIWIYGKKKKKQKTQLNPNQVILFSFKLRCSCQCSSPSWGLHRESCGWHNPWAWQCRHHCEWVFFIWFSILLPPLHDIVYGNLHFNGNWRYC